MEANNDREVFSALFGNKSADDLEKIIGLNKIFKTLSAAQLTYLLKLSTLLFC